MAVSFFTNYSCSTTAGYVGGMFFCQARISFNQRTNSKAEAFLFLYKRLISKERWIRRNIFRRDKQEVKEEHGGCAHNYVTHTSG